MFFEVFFHMKFIPTTCNAAEKPTFIFFSYLQENYSEHKSTSKQKL